MIAAVILQSKPQFRDSILRQVESQNIPSCKIIQVHNVKGVSKARNIGLEKARQARADKVVFIDCDDLYSPYYLKELDQALDNHVVVGKPIVYIHDTMKDEYWVVSEESLNNAPIITASGGTLGFRLEHAMQFAEDLDYMEDFDWCMNMNQAGFKLHTLSPKNYIKRQFGSGHTCPLDTESMVFGARKLPGLPDWY